MTGLIHFSCGCWLVDASHGWHGLSHCPEHGGENDGGYLGEGLLEDFAMEIAIGLGWKPPCV